MTRFAAGVAVATPAAGTAYRYFRLAFTANNGDAHSQVGEWELFDAEATEHPASDMSDNSTPSPLVASDDQSSAKAYRCFDGSPADGFVAELNSATSGWWKIDLGSGNEIVLSKVQITCGQHPTVSLPPRMIKDFTVEGSNTGAFSGEEEVLITVTGATGWSEGEEREYTV